MLLVTLIIMKIETECQSLITEKGRCYYLTVTFLSKAFYCSFKNVWMALFFAVPKKMVNIDIELV